VASVSAGLVRLAALVSVAWLAATPAAGPAGAAETMTVARVRVVGDYLTIRLSGRSPLAFVAHATEACAQVLRPESRVAWIDRGGAGRLEGHGAVCELAGLLDLETWRDRRPRPAARPAPRATARYRVVAREGGTAVLRGRFPLAGLVGIPGGQDLVALVDDDERCAGILADDAAALEFRDAGRTAFRLGPTCAVRGFARPAPAAR